MIMFDGLTEQDKKEIFDIAIAEYNRSGVIIDGLPEEVEKQVKEFIKKQRAD